MKMIGKEDRASAAVTTESEPASHGSSHALNAHTVEAGCARKCLETDVERCVTGWPDGSCGARGQGTQWPKDVRAQVPKDDWTVGDVVYAAPERVAAPSISRSNAMRNVGQASD
jgi:hypothetical protein